MLHLFLIRGLPGSGKSTLADALGVFNTEADQYFVDEDGNYNFDPSKLPQAHAQCQEDTRASLESGISVAVSNTFTQMWEMIPYIEMARDTGARLTVIDLFDGGCNDRELERRCIHGVPLHAFRAMRQRYEHDWKAGNPLPPWER
jgi:predicted kinase